MIVLLPSYTNFTVTHCVLYAAKLQPFVYEKGLEPTVETAL